MYIPHRILLHATATLYLSTITSRMVLQEKNLHTSNTCVTNVFQRWGIKSIVLIYTVDHPPGPWRFNNG